MRAIKTPLTQDELIVKLHRGLILEYLSAGWMTAEAIVSVVAGILAGSIALVAFGGDSFIELISSLAVTAYLRKRERGKADSKILRRTERITSLLLFALIPVIASSAFYSFFTGTRAEASTLGIVVATAAVVIMPGLWLGKKKIGKETDCLPLSIDAVESATCFLMSLVLLGGLLAISILGLWWVDYLATAVILAIVLREAIESTKELGPGPHS